jgi:adenine deaminase
MPSSSLSRILIDVAMGRRPADLVIQKGTWVCVQSGEFIPDTDIAVKAGRIAYVGPDASHTIGKRTTLIQAGGRYLVPGLLDGHMHVESTMLTITEFVRTVLPHGTTGMFMDPHEIANVFGLKGVRLICAEAADQPVHAWVEVPSCVPSSPDMEISGGALSAEDIGKALRWDNVIGLGEMMNYSGVAAGNPQMLSEMEHTRQAGKVIGGHYASPDLGPAFHAYAVGGAEDDHEGTREEDAVARIRQGMKAMLRYGSAWQDVARQVPAITRLGLDSRHFILCTDDSHAGTLVREGHMDRVLRHAVAQGLPPMTAIQMATLNTAEHFGLAREIGQIAPGRWADILLVEDLNQFQVELVVLRGKVAAEHGRMLLALPVRKYPAWALNSVHLKHPVQPDDFTIRTATRKPRVKVHVIGVLENQAPTRHLILDVRPKEGEIKADAKRDLAKIAVIERHGSVGGIQVGLVSGFSLDEHCAVASTVAHDCHQLLVLGTDEQDMALAANALVEVGGGQVVVKNGRIIAMVELRLAGLMSIEWAEKVAKKTEAVLEGMRSCGCRLNNANMTLSLLALVVIPELRISAKGLVDVTRSKFLPVVQEEGKERRP